MEIKTLILEALEKRASDLHIVAGLPPALRVQGEIIFMEYEPLKREDTKQLAYSFLNDEQKTRLESELALCPSITLDETGRFRIAIYYRNENPELAIRICPSTIPSSAELNLAPVIDELTRKTSGLILVTGPTGMGKTTTLNYMVDLINSDRRCKIVTIEDPVEFVHTHKKSIVIQQEVHADTHSFHSALTHILRQDPDVIAIGEMRDLETVSTALTAAETGHLVIATLHTPDATQTINRITDIFSPQQQPQIISQLSMTLRAVIAQQLLPRMDTVGRILASEVLIATEALRNIIRERKTEQIYSVIQTGGKFQMQTMDECIHGIYEKGMVTYDTATSRMRDKRILEKR